MALNCVDSAARVSIVLCTYNGELYLSAQLESLLAQSRCPDEIVISDDASSDRTVEVLEAFVLEAQARGVHVIFQRNERNIGYLRNFERALALATGDLVFLCDQDDVWDKDKIRLVVQEFSSHKNALMVHSDAHLIDGRGQRLPLGLFEALGLAHLERKLIRSGRTFEVLLRRNIVTGATAAFRRSLICDALPFPDEWVHDEWLAILAAARGALYTIEKPLIGYRQHAGNQIGLQMASLDSRRHNRIDRRAHLGRVGKRLIGGRPTIRRFIATGHPRWRSLLDGACRHFALRADLPRRWHVRVGSVLAEYARGGYHVFSFGTRSAVADLLALP